LLCLKMKNVSFFLPSGLSFDTFPLASWLCARARALPTRRRASWLRKIYVSLSLSPATITPGQYQLVLYIDTSACASRPPSPNRQSVLFIGTPHSQEHTTHNTRHATFDIRHMTYDTPYTNSHNLMCTSRRALHRREAGTEERCARHRGDEMSVSPTRTPRCPVSPTLEIWCASLCVNKKHIDNHQVTRLPSPPLGHSPSVRDGPSLPLSARLCSSRRMIVHTATECMAK